jgi:hypothetical protein
MQHDRAIIRALRGEMSQIFLSPSSHPARAKPVAVAKDGGPVIVVMAVEEFERLKALDAPATAPARVKKAKE